MAPFNMAVCLSFDSEWSEGFRASRKVLRSSAQHSDSIRICTGCLYVDVGGSEFLDLLILCADLRRLRIVAMSRSFSLLLASAELLDQYRSLSALRELVVRVGSFARYDLFLLLSLLPCLHTLRMTSLRLDYGDTVKAHHEPPESCPTPACSLARLAIVGNMRGAFVHLPLLLRNSHHTLREVYLEHLGDKEAHPAATLVGASVAAALAPCTNVRELALCCHDLLLVPILLLESCARGVRSLTLPRWPYNDELAAIPRGVRRLVIYDMGSLPPEYFPSMEVSEPWYDLRPVAHLPLSELLVVSASPTLADDDPRWMSLKADCARRRVMLSLVAMPLELPALSWVTLPL